MGDRRIARESASPPFFVYNCNIDFSAARAPKQQAFLETLAQVNCRGAIQMLDVILVQAMLCCEGVAIVSRRKRGVAKPILITARVPLVGSMCGQTNLDSTDCKAGSSGVNILFSSGSRTGSLDLILV